MLETKPRFSGRTMTVVLGAAIVATAMTTSAMALPASSAQTLRGVAATGEVQLAGYGHHRHYRHYGHFPRHYPGYWYGYYRPYAYYGPAPVYRPTGCGWLKVRAIETGSRYWWQRYRDCRH